MQKVILFYKFTPLADPEAIRMWQYTLASSLGLTGRVLISEHGINGTLGGDIDALKRYVRVTREYSGFRGTEMKWSPGGAEDFPKLTVKVRDEIVTFGAPEELRVDEGGVIGGGKHLKPAEVNKLVEQKPDTVFFDGRNRYEAEIGRFKDAIVPDVETTRDFIDELDSGKYDHLKNKPVVTYCTGGIRCEVLSSLMVQRGFEEVYQVDGGIVRYGETFGNTGLWEGSLYVFDRRGSVDFGDGAKLLGECVVCGDATNRVGDCAEPSCTRQMVAHEGCESYCPAHAAAA
ncbi:MAG TPA: rhodanese-related sulfurtransferase [Candidatus Agrococcus pullicola]|uniref:tRNA uridine(34) hydroxylase n=1 Tax=Candidatus Agrococcus pullicola TaxID=2838429 RepID=A0A9D2C974_9MICO|nr:rhodanese-related sulfurtransferase [Candidatus Agrococcus pullicola]